MSRRKRSKRWISWLIVVVLLIVAVIFCYLVWDNYFNNKKEDIQEDSDISTQIESESNNVEGNLVNEKEEDDKKIKQYEGEDPNEAKELSGVVTYAGVMNNKVVIRANIDQYLNSGKCQLNLINGKTMVYEEIVQISSAASTATCEGFDIPLSEFSNGDYEIIIKLEANEKSGIIKGMLEI